MIIFLRIMLIMSVRVANEQRNEGQGWRRGDDDFTPGVKLL